MNGGYSVGDVLPSVRKSPSRLRHPGQSNLGAEHITNQESGQYSKNTKFQEMMNKRKRLYQTHIFVEYLERKHDIVLKIEMMLGVRIQRHMDLFWAGEFEF